jgi:hypothetical protein
MPSATDVKPFIGSFDFESSRDFYIALGWKLNWEKETIAELELGDCRFFLQRYYNKTFCENLMLHITVDDAQAWYEHVRTIIESNSFPSANEDEPRVDPPKTEEDRGQLVTYVWDPAGVLLHFAQRLS